MITPCCKKKIGEDEIWNLCEEDTFGVTNKSITCPYCNASLTVYLSIDSIEVDD